MLALGRNLAPDVPTVVRRIGPRMFAFDVPPDAGAEPLVIGLIGSDEDGTHILATKTITFAAAPMVLNFAGFSGVEEGSEYLLMLEEPIDGATGEPVPDVYYFVDFGDGTSDLHVNRGIEHVYRDGSLDFTIVVDLVDADGNLLQKDAARHRVTVANVNPRVPFIGDRFISPGDLLSMPVTFTDPGNDVWAASIDWGDGAGPQPVPVNPDKSVTLEKRFTAGGQYMATLTVTDGDGGLGTRTFQVNVEGLSVKGTDGDDIWYVRRDGDNLNIWPTADASGTPITLSYATSNGLTFQGLGGNDTLILERSGGDLPALLNFQSGGDPGDVLVLQGGQAAETLDIATGNVDWGPTTVAYEIGRAHV